MVLLVVIMAGFDEAIATVYSFLGLQATSNAAIMWSMLFMPVILGMIATAFSTDSNFQLRLPFPIIMFIWYSMTVCILLASVFLAIGGLSPDSSARTELIKNAYYVVFATSALLSAIVFVGLLFSSRFRDNIPPQLMIVCERGSLKKIVLVLVLFYTALGGILLSHPIPINQQYLMFVISGTYYESVGIALSIHLFLLLGILGGFFLVIFHNTQAHYLRIPKSSVFLGITHSAIIGLAYSALGYLSTVYYMFFSSLLVSVFLFSLGGVLALMISGEKPFLI